MSPNETTNHSVPAASSASANTAESTSATTAAPDRAAINRDNSQNSTGPRTEAGKEQVRYNALRHGLYAEAVVLPSEDQAAYLALGQRLATQYAPTTDEERALVQTLQDAEWRLSRIASLESGVLAIGQMQCLEITRERFPHLDLSTAEAVAKSAGYMANMRVLDQLGRHESRLRRLIDRTRRDLSTIMSTRKPQSRVQTAGFVPSISEQPAPRPAVTPQPAPVAPHPAAPVLAPPSKPMPKFSGPNRKEDRKRWLREQNRKQNAQSVA